jgi:hypothetical protein
MKTKTKTKPVVKYSTAKGTFAGERYKLRYRRTLLATIKGPEAKALGDNRDTTYWSYDTEKQVLQIFKEELLDD